MNFLQIAGKDIKAILKNRLIRVSVIAIIVVPLLYSLLYLYAFWDPYSRIEDMPVAVVNLDKGTVLDGEKTNYGNGVVDNLEENKTVGWKFVSKEEAKEGLEGNDYYAILEIPEDFSANVVSAKSGTPTAAGLTFTCNEKKNFLAAQVNSKVESALKEKIVSTITKSYVKVAFDNLYTVKDGMVTAADGSTQIKIGLNTLNEKVPELADGVTKLSDGSKELYNGQITLGNGISAVNNGLGTLKTKLAEGNGKIAELQTGAAQLNVGSDGIAKGSSDINIGYSKVNSGVSQLLSKVDSSNKSIAEIDKNLKLAMDPNNAAMKDAIINNIIKGLDTKLDPKTDDNIESAKKLNELVAGLGNLGKGIPLFNTQLQNYTAGVKNLTTGTTTLTNSVREVQNGVNQLYDGSTKLATGSKKLVDGQLQSKDGLSTLNSKIPDLKDGVGKLYDGSSELATKLSEGANKLGDGLVNSSEDMAKFVASPVEMKIEPLNAVPNYGTGFAPYFINLSLWIGAIMMFFVISAKTDEYEGVSRIHKALGKYLSFAFIGVIQAVLVGIAVLCLGLEPENTPLYFGILIFCSLVFIAIVQFLISLFGDAGRLLSIVFLILQLTACAGTFPLELVPNIFRVLNPFMPFTYAVEAMREICSASVINYGTIVKDLLILGIFFVVFLGGSIIFKHTGDKIQQILEGKKEEAFKN